MRRLQMGHMRRKSKKRNLQTKYIPETLNPKPSETLGPKPCMQVQTIQGFGAAEEQNRQS